MGCDLVSPTTAVLLWKGQESRKNLAQETGCLSSCNLMLEPWRVSKELLGFSLCGILEKWVLIPVKECLSNRINELARESEDRQAKSKIFFTPHPFIYAIYRRWSRALGRVFPPQMTPSRHSLTAVPSCLSFS